jgi:type IV pilus assembly protein PilO
MKKISLNNFYDWPLTMRALILGLLFAVVFYFGYSWDISHMSSKLLSAQQKEKDMKEQLKSVIQKQYDLKYEISHSSQLNKTLIQWQNQLISYSELPKLLNTILKLGANNNLQFPLFQPQPDVKENLYYKVPIKIIAVGKYHQLASFISDVANMPWIIAINDFTITNEIKNDLIGPKFAKQAAEENLLTASFNFEVYYIADAKKPVP